MGSTGSVSSWEKSLLTALIQYPVPVIHAPEDIKVQVDQICRTIDNTKAGYPGLDLMYTLAVNLASYDEVFYYFSEGTICNYDGNVIQQGHRNPWESVTAELFPRLVDKARENWALENNIFNLGCRAYVGKPGGEHANYLTWVRDLAEGKYKLPWDAKIKIRDGWEYYPDGVKLGSMPK